MAKRKVPGLRAAINAKCKDCIHDPKAPGSWLKQVTDCIDDTCPLFLVRPKSKVKPSVSKEAPAAS